MQGSAGMKSTTAIVRAVARPPVPTRAAFAGLSRSFVSKSKGRASPPSYPIQRGRPFSSPSLLRKEDVPSSSGLPTPTLYAYQEISDLSRNRSPNRILIDVREPGELLQTGRIPSAKSVPISSAPDAFFMNEDDFEAKFGFPRPGKQDEVIFYCKAGVRSRQAALLAGQAVPAFGGKIGNYIGSWLDWEKNGGSVEREGEQGEQSTVTGSTNPGQGAPGTPRP